MTVFPSQLRKRDSLGGNYCTKLHYEQCNEGTPTVCSAIRFPMRMVWKPWMILPAVMCSLTATPHTRLGSARTGGLLWRRSFLSDTSTLKKRYNQ